MLYEEYIDSCPLTREPPIWLRGREDYLLLEWVHSLLHKIYFQRTNGLNINTYRLFTNRYSNARFAVRDGEIRAILDRWCTIFVVKEGGCRVQDVGGRDE